MADLGGASIRNYRERQNLDTEYISGPAHLLVDEYEDSDSGSDDAVMNDDGRPRDYIDEVNDFFFLEKMRGRRGRLYRLRQPELLQELHPVSRARYERMRVSVDAVRNYFLNPATTQRFLNREIQNMDTLPIHALVTAMGTYPAQKEHRCRICLEKHSAKVLSVTMTCGHHFDAECLSGWFRLTSVLTCPTCRWDIRIDHPEPWVPLPGEEETDSEDDASQNSTPHEEEITMDQDTDDDAAHDEVSQDEIDQDVVADGEDHQNQESQHSVINDEEEIGQETTTVPGSVSNPTCQQILLPHQRTVFTGPVAAGHDLSGPGTAQKGPASGSASQERLLPRQRKVFTYRPTAGGSFTLAHTRVHPRTDNAEQTA
ncbi:hypothetical protein BJ166DRAFT_628958 [Pestalotiopsis sp. NC0098]|nr:hypothetical protein BJ166DRAFT_628958 [Pestalotiopsis sp. NC0098]